MTGTFRLKTPNCIEWTVNLISDIIISNSFTLQNRICTFEYMSRERYDPRYLNCRSNLSFPTPIDIIAHCTNSNDFKKTQFSGKRQEILRISSSPYPLPLPLTFQVIIFADISIGSEPGYTSKGSTHQECLTYLEKNFHFQALSRDFSKLLNNDSSFDLVIKCDDKTFNAHKIVLQTRSPVFAAMLKSDMVEGKTGLVNVKEIEYSILECFLRYLYSGVLPGLSNENAKKLYNVGDQYAVEELKKACAEFMTNNLSDSNACDLLVLADLHSDEDFRKKVVAYIVEKKIPQRSTNWSDFCKSHSSLATEVFTAYIRKYCPM